MIFCYFFFQVPPAQNTSTQLTLMARLVHSILPCKQIDNYVNLLDKKSIDFAASRP